MDAEIGIVGAGPVGSALAIMLGRAGVRTILLEKAAFPRDKACGEGLMPAGARVLAELGCPLDRFPPAAGVTYRIAGRGNLDGRFARGQAGRGTRRLVLDQLLAERAAATENVSLERECACAGVEVEPAGILIRTARGDLQTRHVVAADGLHSGIARWLGWSRPARGGRYALVGHLEAPGHGFDRIVVTLLGDRELYLAPTAGDELLLAVLGPKGGLRAPGESTRDAYRRHVAAGHPELGGCSFAGIRGAGPFWVRPATVAGDGVFLVGDAAGFLDPLTGDGMTAGLAAARRLAELLATGHPQPESAYRRWEVGQWRRRLFMTRLALSLTGSTRLAPLALRGLRRRPAALTRLLELNEGSRGLLSLRPRDWAALAGI